MRRQLGNIQVVHLDLFRSSFCSDSARLFNHESKKKFQCFGFVVTNDKREVSFAFRFSKIDKTRGHVHITIGVAWATLPTSSSFCMIFFIRACGSSWVVSIKVHVHGKQNVSKQMEKFHYVVYNTA